MAYSAITFSSNALFQPVTQVAYTLAVGDVVRWDGTNFVQAQADSVTNAAMVGMVSRLNGVDQFYITQVGFVSGITTQVFIPGDLYYLDPANPGMLTNIASTTPGEILAPCFIAFDTDTGFFFENVGVDAGGAGANTALSNLISTAVNQSLLPGTDLNFDIGAFNFRWAAVFPETIETGHTNGDVYYLTAYNTNTTTATVFATVTAGNPPTFNLENGVTAITQSPGDNSTKLATTAYVDDAAISAPVIVGPPFNALNLCVLPGMFGATTSDNITQTLDFNAAIFLIPFYVADDITTTIVEVMVTTSLAASDCTVGIYGSVADKPSGAALGAVAIATTATGNQNGALAIALSKKTLYWAAVQCSSAVTQALLISQLNNYPGSPGGGFGATSYTPAVFTYSNTYASGTLPSITSGSLNTVATGYGPMIWFV